MTKLFTASQVRELDAATIAQEPIASIDLMERAAAAFVEEFVRYFGSEAKVLVCCGPGNNGGDGFAIARLLLDRGCQVSCQLVMISNSLSVDCTVNLERLEKRMDVERLSGAPVVDSECAVIIDALFGSGLNRPVEGLASEVIKELNNSGKPIVSVDIPSGLFADEIELNGAIVQASRTITFQFPKLTLLLPETGAFAGKVSVVNIDLLPSAIADLDTPYVLIEKDFADKMLRRRPKFAHKGDFGRVQLVAGSHGKIGAAVLSAKACLRTGAGLLTVHIPRVGYDVLQGVVPEAMVTTDKQENYISDISILPKTDVWAIGPGIGTKEETGAALKELLREISAPVVFDADALNLLSKDNELLDLVPKGSVFTPHVGEFDRLFGPSNNTLDRLDKMQQYARKSGNTIVLKGAHSIIVNPEGLTAFNSTGNPGMATAGSGDVLTGVIAGLLGQKYPAFDAAALGVFIHGMAGDFAEKKLGEMSLMASDLLDELSKAINNV